MQVIQPQIKELQKKYKNDRGKLQEETMKLYQEHRVNPFASCLPLVLQLPVFISLYDAIKGRAGDRRLHASWASRSGEPSIILLIIYVVTQIISTELMLVTQTDKTQKMIMRAMPIIFVRLPVELPGRPLRLLDHDQRLDHRPAADHPAHHAQARGDGGARQGQAARSAAASWRR